MIVLACDRQIPWPLCCNRCERSSRGRLRSGNRKEELANLIQILQDVDIFDLKTEKNRL